MTSLVRIDPRPAPASHPLYPLLHARVFSAVPLRRSGLSGTLALSYIVLTHLFFLGWSVIGLFLPAN
jgi:hypothetical protein